jgi:hypothetical protein
LAARSGDLLCDGWFEWKREGDKKQPYFIHRKDAQPILMAAIGSTPFERGDEAEGFLIVTAGLIKVSLISMIGARLSWYRTPPGSG